MTPNSTAARSGLAWYRAATLSERAAATVDVESRPPSEASNGADDLSTYRLRMWTTRGALASPALLTKRLASDNLDFLSFERLALEGASSLRRRFKSAPPWADAIERAIRAPVSDEVRASIDRWSTAAPTAGFLRVAAYFIESALAALRRALDELSAPASSPRLFDQHSAPDLVLHGLVTVLRETLTPTLVLEMNVDRLENRLKGDTPETRFASFVQSLSDPERLHQLFDEYPVLGRSLDERCRDWTMANAELFRRLALDAALLTQRFSGSQGLGRLGSVELGLGDPRTGGRTSAILAFDSGVRIVYQPKSVAVDRHFQALLAWINDRAFLPPLRPLTILDRGEYGWVEFVESRPCTDLAEVGRFYERQGAYLALQHALRGTDLHADNIIAAGEHPVLVDIEAMFQPVERAGDSPTSADDLAQATIDSSVLEVGLLPERSWANGRYAGLDVSGLSNHDVQVAPSPVHRWDRPATDTMHLVRDRGVIRASCNRPTLPGARVDLVSHRDDLTRGFSRMYEFLAHQASALLAEDGPVRAFANDPIRVFVRSVSTYRRQLSDSRHPDMLRDALDRDRLFDALWARADDDEQMAAVVPVERASLLRGSIPTFTTKPMSRDLLLPNGERVAHYYREAGFPAVEKRLRSLSSEDLARQRWFIDASFATLSTPPVSMHRANRRRPAAAATRSSALVLAACAIGDHLLATSFRHEQTASWISTPIVDGRAVGVAVAGLDLAGGMPGPILFLSHLGLATGDERYTELARAGVATLINRLADGHRPMGWIGAFDGWGGLVYVFAQVGSLWGDQRLIDLASEWASELPPRIANDQCLDIYGGAAGCIAALRALHSVSPSKTWVELATQCGQHLLKRAERVSGGLAWTPELADMAPDGGFLHGDIGIAWALRRLGHWTGDRSFSDAANTAVRGLTLDVKTNGDPVQDVSEVAAAEAASSTAYLHHPSCRTTWCGGTSGLGFALLDADASSSNSSAIVALLDDVSAHGPDFDHSLCHGLMGGADLLVEAASRLDDVRWLELAKHLIRRAMAHDPASWISGVPGGLVTPGLLTGLSGIGYELLRVTWPEAVPSILLLESRRTTPANSPYTLRGEATPR